jgi:hypothetical protein
MSKLGETIKDNEIDSDEEEEQVKGPVEEQIPEGN